MMKAEDDKIDEDELRLARIRAANILDRVDTSTASTSNGSSAASMQPQRPRFANLAAQWQSNLQAKAKSFSSSIETAVRSNSLWNQSNNSDDDDDSDSDNDDKNTKSTQQRKRQLISDTPAASTKATSVMKSISSPQKSLVESPMVFVAIFRNDIRLVRVQELGLPVAAVDTAKDLVKQIPTTTSEDWMEFPEQSAIPSWIPSSTYQGIRLNVYQVQESIPTQKQQQDVNMTVDPRLIVWSFSCVYDRQAIHEQGNSCVDDKNSHQIVKDFLVQLVHETFDFRTNDSAWLHGDLDACAASFGPTLEERRKLFFKQPRKDTDTTLAEDILASNQQAIRHYRNLYRVKQAAAKEVAAKQRQEQKEFSVQQQRKPAKAESATLIPQTDSETGNATQSAPNKIEQVEATPTESPGERNVSIENSSKDPKQPAFVKHLVDFAVGKSASSAQATVPPAPVTTKKSTNQHSVAQEEEDLLKKMEAMNRVVLEPQQSSHKENEAPVTMDRSKIVRKLPPRRRPHVGRLLTALAVLIAAILWQHCDTLRQSQLVKQTLEPLFKAVTPDSESKGKNDQEKEKTTGRKMKRKMKDKKEKAKM